jgi:serine/threonine protein phosphatase 1
MQWLRRLMGKNEPTPEVAADGARVFRVPEGVRVYAVGDIHGRGDVLVRLMDAIAADVAANPCPEIVEVFLGDYVDRGMQSQMIIEMLHTTTPLHHARVCLMGNHEEAMLNFIDDPKQLRQWGNMGGYATLASYGMGIPAAMTPDALVEVRDELVKRMPPAHLAFLRGLQLRHQEGDYLFVHAGIDPRRPLEKQSREHLLWIRKPFLEYEAYHERYVVHGHSPVAKPDIRHHRANLDVSGAAVESLCCLILEGEKRRCLLATRDRVDLWPIT